ncbi:peptidylprolyl isomerase [Paenibacillus thermotolerans]|uniref:peptidylprolyl isomerase n=1 Tax=Paenibacillus thermotolerans TaxID=3027807 RepID=UPI0023686D07|nr:MULTISPECIES: peptidylprolyl isomerase [unclassified Paenibacillus]
MSREKLLWSAISALVAAAATYSLLLAFPPHAWPENRTGAPSSPEDRSIQPPSSSSPDPVAVVGDVKLSREQYVSGLDRQYGKGYVQEWMERTAVRLEAQALGIDVQHEEIERELERMQSGYDSEEQFYRTMEEELGLTKEQLREDALYRLQLIKIASYGIKVTDSDVERYIDEHPDEYGPVTELRLAQITTETAGDAEAVLDRLGQGYEFDQLAREYSIDKDTSADGGDLGWVAEDDPFVPVSVMEAADRMKVGEVSRVITLDEGLYAVVTVLGRRTLRPGDDRAVREQVRHDLLLAKAPPINDVLSRLLEKWGAKSAQ